MERYVCIHGHFYQPPRENAWLEYLEWQDSAYPYHDWNERIMAECYMPNASSRILDSEGLVEKLVNNYTRISFNFGPTLLAWIERNDSQAYKAILEADQQSRKIYSGHGSAIAQAYNHIIMPLANRRDRYSQVLWGIKDFEYRFRRKPEGMWLPETAVDIDTLEIMAELGITFTILSPHQARRVRRSGAQNWKDVSGGAIDPTRAYKIDLPSGRRMSLFFYDSQISKAVAFEDILNNGEIFAKRLISAFSEKRRWPQLVNIASDGETYGHHHHFADMALAYTIQYIETNKLARITNYGEYLEKFPPGHDVEIIENTSWSCAHGIERWRSDCGDTTGNGNHKDWNQKWRAPLRNAFDWLRDTMAVKYEEAALNLVKDPWAARDGYIDVILDRSPENVERFFGRYSRHVLDSNEKITLLKLLELQRHAMLMYASCGWFFDEISRPEPVQVIQYAGRALQLGQELFGDSIEEKFLKILEQAKSNIPEQGDGRTIYDNFVRPARVDLLRLAGHYVIKSIFQKAKTEKDIYCYQVENEEYQMMENGKIRMITGRTRVKSTITWESEKINFVVFQNANQTVQAGVQAYLDEESYQAMVQDFSRTFSLPDFNGVINLLEKYFGDSKYSLKSLFRDDQRKMLVSLMDSTISTIGPAYRQLYQQYFTRMRYLSELGGPVPRDLRSVMELIINVHIKQEANDETIDAVDARNLIDTARNEDVALDVDGIGYAYKLNLEKMMRKLEENPGAQDNLNNIIDKISLARSLPIPLDLCKIQNIYWHMLENVYQDFLRQADKKENTAINWIESFEKLGRLLQIKKAKTT
jgi:alpha-amylase/alpha-mannosidase (GH57 family)